MRSIDWEMMPYFLAVARSGSLRSGASLLNVSYGTLNRNIQALESSYGARLFHRSRKGFTLTEAGMAILPLAESSEEILQKARHRVEGLDRTEAGRIRFSLPQMLGYDIVAPIIAKFQNLYPAIQVEVRITSDVESIPDGTTDVGLRGAYEIDEDVVAKKLYRIAVSLFASQTYVETVFPTAGSNGAGLSWIGMSENQDTKNLMKRAGYPLADIRHIVTDGHMRLCLLRQGCGMSHLPLIFESLYTDICRVPQAEVTLDRYLWIVCHEDLAGTVRVRRFVDFLMQELIDLKPLMQGELFQK
ncbi:LysR family transcriptional regulator [Lentilitoribacter sp. EG35]|uniref:LysR family transcriptional regulator n=1 Tax=Lentilitoribacter sp. EG35 TaxID=3234192 RepID=UPI003460A948